MNEYLHLNDEIISQMPYIIFDDDIVFVGSFYGIIFHHNQFPHGP